MIFSGELNIEQLKNYIDNFLDKITFPVAFMTGSVFASVLISRAKEKSEL